MPIIKEYRTTKTDVQHENFDLYFHRVAERLTPNQIEKLPDEFKRKIFTSAYDYKYTAANKMTFLEKVFVLWKALNKKVFIMVEDSEFGMTTEQFLEFRESEKKKSVGQDVVDGLNFSSTFVTANKELCQTFDFLNQVSVSPLYNYLLKRKNDPKNKIADWKDQMNYIVKCLSHYESKKKSMIMKSGLTMPEILVLIYLYGKDYQPTRVIWKEVYPYCFQSSKPRIKAAFGILQSKGHITKIGNSKACKIRITALGVAAVNELVYKYFLDF